MEHWRQVLPVPMLEVDYEELVADLETWSRAIVAWCGLEWDPACLEFHKTSRPVRTSSVEQVRQPIYTSSVGRWKNYERSLAPLFANLKLIVQPVCIRSSPVHIRIEPRDVTKRPASVLREIGPFGDDRMHLVPGLSCQLSGSPSCLQSVPGKNQGIDFRDPVRSSPASGMSGRSWYGPNAEDSSIA